MTATATITGTIAANALTGTAASELIQSFLPGTTTTTAAGASVVIESNALGLPVTAVALPGEAGMLLVVGKSGAIRQVDTNTGAVSTTPLLDISSEVDDRGEQGLLGLALHPEFWANGRFYVFFSNLAGDSVVREYSVDPADRGSVLAGSGRDVLTIPQPGTTTNHKAGTLAFDDAGMLFITVGDGGGGNDPLETGQNPDDLLGSVLRIDIDGDDFPADASRNYAIPGDNPFADGVDGAPEVWAFGLRNPYRASVDRGTGTLWIGDVGQAAFEEVNIGRAGANFGWDLFEGYGGPAAGITFPVHAYGRNDGDRSITGGVVQRGPESGLFGDYVFGDYVSGRVWTLADDDANGMLDRTQINASVLGGGSLVSFAEDGEGTIFLVGIDGRIARLNAGAPTGQPDGADTIDAGAGNDRVFTGAGNDRATGSIGNDLVSGMEGADTLLGSAGADTLLGGAGNDTLSGGSGVDVLNGGAGGDALYGGTGNDVLMGGLGADLLVGGDGADRFRWGSVADSVRGQRSDRVADFDGAQGDRLDLSALAPGLFAFIGDARFAATGAQIRVVRVDDVTRVEASVDGGPLDFALLVTSAAPLSAADFLF